LPQRSDFLAKEALWVLMLTPPLISLLMAELGSSLPSPANAAGCLLSTWICTLGAGLILHHAVNWSAPRVFGAVRNRLAAWALLAVIGATSILLAMLAILPRLGWLSPHSQEDMPTSVLRALALGALYLASARVAAVVAARARNQAARVRTSEEDATRSRLSALHAQASPHFLFNTLNSVASLIPVDPQEAEATIERLAGVLQYSISSKARGAVPLEEELTAIRDYLGIEQTRFGDRLRTHIDVSPDLRNQTIPPMLLQPLVENAVLHGLASREEGGEIRITGRAESGSAVFTITDNGVGPGASTRRGTRTGLQSVRERLALTYGDAAEFQIRAAAGGGFECELRVPRA
jgi:two-component sensor histidine kinase